MTYRVAAQNGRLRIASVCVLLIALQFAALPGCGAKSEADFDRSDAATQQTPPAHQEESEPERAVESPDSSVVKEHVEPQQPAGGAASSWAQGLEDAYRNDMLEQPSTKSTDVPSESYAVSPPHDPAPNEPLLAAPDERASPTSKDLPTEPGAAAVSAKRIASFGPRETNVEIFFATDRLPTAELLPSLPRAFAPAGIVAMISAALFVGFSLAKRFVVFWFTSCGIALLLLVMVLHSSIIRWQQSTRLATNSSTRFSEIRDDQPRDYPLHVGTARVSLPPNHKPGHFEQANVFRFEYVETPQKHIVLHSLQLQSSAEAWFEEISLATQYSRNDEAFVFIHGYNVRFIDALKRTAQLANDLELAGPAICYSWPSRGDVVAYTADEASVAWSVPHLERLLIDLHSRTGCRNINVVAHSMGNRALLNAIERIDMRLSAQPAEAPSQKMINSIVMAAPDVDSAEFANRYATPIQNLSRRVTLYFSESDRALLLSAGLHGAPRLGLLGENSRAWQGIEAVCVGTRQLFGLGHSYYGDDPIVIEDLKALLRDNQAAANRGFLQRVTDSSGTQFWEIDRSLSARTPAASQR